MKVNRDNECRYSRREYISKSAVYYMMGELGRGSLSEVKLVRDGQGKPFALKIINKAIMEKVGAEENLMNEIRIQSKLSHKNIVKLYETFEDEELLYLVLEYCQQGNLYRQMQNKIYSSDQTFDVLNQVLAALDHLHSKNIVHRDLKPENILLHDDGTYKICDFGWAVTLAENESCKPCLCGTTLYMPPEVVLNHAHDYKVDIWSLGVITYELLHGKQPFIGGNQQQIIQKILQTIQISERVNEDLQILLYAMLAKATSLRPSCKQIYQCKWMRKMMKEHNLYNKYENELLKKQQINKQVQIKTLGNNCFDIKTKSEQISETSSLNQSHLSAPPMIPNTSQNIFDSVPKVSSPAFPQF